MVNADFERCTDFLARMIEKYGGELELPKTEENDMNDTTQTRYTGVIRYKSQKVSNKFIDCGQDSMIK